MACAKLSCIMVSSSIPYAICSLLSFYHGCPMRSPRTKRFRPSGRSLRPEPDHHKGWGGPIHGAPTRGEFRSVGRVETTTHDHPLPRHRRHQWVVTREGEVALQGAEGG